MNNFGVIELASARTTSAPGWAYVPDTRLNLTLAHGQQQASAGGTQNRKKRARNATGGGLTLGDLTARQENKIRKELEALDRDISKDNTIPVPAKPRATAYSSGPGGVGGGGSGGKHTPNVRKILQSQKTFANHLDDFLAMQALSENNTVSTSYSVSNNISNAATPANKRALVARKATPSATGTPKPAGPEDDSLMLDIDTAASSELGTLREKKHTLFRASYRPAPPAHPSDTNPLLASRVPPLPTDDEMRKLLAHPPLSYGEARGNWDDDNGTYPTRVFCEVCGYWGRVRCMKCGTRVCALDCLETHREDCMTRYGI